MRIKAEGRQTFRKLTASASVMRFPEAGASPALVPLALRRHGRAAQRMMAS